METRLCFCLCVFTSLLLSAVSCDGKIEKASSTTTTWGSYQCDKFKAPNPSTDAATAQRWHEEDEALWKYVNDHVPDVLDHTGSAAFDEHLKGVQAVLRYWGAPTHLTNAGLFHSIYGTEGFQGFSLPLSQREAIRSLIGEQAEKLAFVFCMLDRSTFDETVFAWSYPNDNTTFQLRARPELGRFQMDLTKEEWLDFVELTLADWMEQVEGAAEKENKIFLWKKGQAYAYRRKAYAKMVQILAAERKDRLSEIPNQMHQNVMSTEGSETRHLVQPRTPPMSQAASDALAALRAVGEAIAEDLSPQPIEECDA